MSSFLFGFLVAFQADGSNEAEKLYRAFSEKLEAAKTLKVVYQAFNEEGSIILAPGNKFCIQGKYQMDKKTEALPKVVSDGAKVAVILDEPRRNPNDESLLGSGKAPPAYANDIRNSLKAGGYYHFQRFTGFHSWLFKKYVPLLPYTAANFQLAGKEKVGQHPAQIIKYRLIDQVDKELMLSETLWLDLKTNLPLKRVTKIWRDEEKPSIFTETYSEFAINPKTDPKVFELPKK